MGWPQSDLDSQLALHLKWISAEPEEEFNLLEIMNLLKERLREIQPVWSKHWKANLPFFIFRDKNDCERLSCMNSFKLNEIWKFDNIPENLLLIDK